MYKRFEELLKIKGVKVADVCRETGIGRSTMTSWKQGKYNIKEDKKRALANYFGVSLAVMTGDEPIPDELYEKSNVSRPVYEVAAGEGRINGDYSDLYIDGADYEEDCSWIHICGDSMMPVLMDGDYVKIHHQTETLPNDMTVVQIDGESATVKHVEIVDNGVWLRANNKEVYEDRFYSVTDVMTMPIKIIGKVVELKRRF